MTRAIVTRASVRTQDGTWLTPVRIGRDATALTTRRAYAEGESIPVARAGRAWVMAEGERAR